MNVTLDFNESPKNNLTCAGCNHEFSKKSNLNKHLATDVCRGFGNTTETNGSQNETNNHDISSERRSFEIIFERFHQVES